ncbi:hypothetical protein B0H17DRAFT_1198052 [Mycena rosella]|uniref:Uncharacterized protein n=1 Tax=Mycena rosella TaxID=1033263 RepID=A0AAD7GII7_MYCRO|nr:hypothetical protein B0H17DRAFT_1198052 [Mycena rosella]
MLRYLSSTAARAGGLSSTTSTTKRQAGSICTHPGSHSKATVSPVRCDPAREHHPNPAHDARPRSRRIALGLGALVLALYIWISWMWLKSYEATKLFHEYMSRLAAMKQLASAAPGALLDLMHTYNPMVSRETLVAVLADLDPAAMRAVCQQIHTVQDDEPDTDMLLSVGAILISLLNSTWIPSSLLWCAVSSTLTLCYINNLGRDTDS